MKKELFLFDLDGTITDSKQGIINSIQFALKKFDIDEKNIEKLENFIGPPLTESFQKYYNMSKEESFRAVDFYREYFANKGIYENQVYAGIEQVFIKLKRLNKSLIVATSKPEVFAKKIIKYFNFDKYFDLIAGSTLDGSISEKHDVINYALSNIQIPKEAIVMIGDRKHDILGAYKNNLDSVAVGYGYGSIAEQKKCKPTYFAKTVEDLEQILLNIW